MLCRLINKKLFKFRILKIRFLIFEVYVNVKVYKYVFYFMKINVIKIYSYYFK